LLVELELGEELMGCVLDEDFVKACHGHDGAGAVANDFHFEERFDEVDVYEDLRFRDTNDTTVFFIEVSRDEAVELNDLSHGVVLSVLSG
jgi:hypothetical protein